MRRYHFKHPVIFALFGLSLLNVTFGQNLVLKTQLDPLDPPGPVAEIPLIGTDSVDASDAFEVLGRDTVLGSVLSASPGYYYSYLEPFGELKKEEPVHIFMDLVYYLQGSYQYLQGSREVLIGAGIRLKITADLHPRVSPHSWEEVKKGIKKGRVKGILTLEVAGLADPELSALLPGSQPLTAKAVEEALRLAEELTLRFAPRPTTKLTGVVLASRYHPPGQQQQMALPSSISIGVIGQQIQQQKSH